MPPNIDPGNKDIEDALREFEEKNPETAAKPVPVPEKTTLVTRITHWLTKHSHGLITEEGGATYLLAGLAVVVIIISIFIVLTAGPDIPEAARKNPEYGLPIAD